MATKKLDNPKTQLFRLIQKLPNPKTQKEKKIKMET